MGILFWEIQSPIQFHHAVPKMLSVTDLPKITRLEMAIPEVVYRSDTFKRLFTPLCRLNAKGSDPLHVSLVPYCLSIFPGAVQGIFVPIAQGQSTLTILNEFLGSIRNCGTISRAVVIPQQVSLQDTEKIRIAFNLRLGSNGCDGLFPVRITLLSTTLPAILSGMKRYRNPALDEFEIADLYQRFGLLQ